MTPSTRVWIIIGTLQAAQKEIAEQHAGLRYKATYERDPKASTRVGGTAWKATVTLFERDEASERAQAKRWLDSRKGVH